MYSGWSGLSGDIHFVGFRRSFHALSPLLIVLSKNFNHPHPYIEIATDNFSPCHRNRYRNLSLCYSKQLSFFLPLVKMLY